MQLSLFFISQCSVLLLDAVMYSTQVSLLSSVPRLFFLKFYVMAAWGKGKAGAERQNSIIGACFHKLFHSCSNAFWRWKRRTKKKKKLKIKLLELNLCNLASHSKNEGKSETKVKTGNEAIFTLPPFSC